MAPENRNSCYFDVVYDEQEHAAGRAQDWPSGYANTHSFRHHPRSGGDRSFHTIRAAKTRLAERSPTARLPEGQLRAIVEDRIQAHQNGTADRRESHEVSRSCGSCEWSISGSSAATGSTRVLTLLVPNSESCGCSSLFLSHDSITSIDSGAFNTAGLSDLQYL